MISSFIIYLHNHSRPSAILWFIVTVYINTIKRMLGTRPITHISPKIFKLAPPITHSDTTPSIIFIFRNFLVITPSKHCSPSLIFRSAAHSVCLGCCFQAFTHQASATSGMLSKQIPLTNNRNSSTDTYTLPSTSLLLHNIATRRTSCVKQTANFLRNSQASKRLTHKVYKFTIRISQDVFSFLENIAVRVVRSFRFSQPVFIVS